ncbi:MAG: superoxide dismutase [Chloroflexi bacterium]|nr:superoxide dismutase [Chloroflexota bacterium]
MSKLNKPSRRAFLRNSALMGAALATPLFTLQVTTQRPVIALAQVEGPFALPELDYAFDALEPNIDARTMEIHYSRHHQGYVNNLNNAVVGTEFETMSLEELLSDLAALPEEIRTTVRNNGGGHANHNLYWDIMSPDGGGQPTGDLLGAMEAAFGDYESFQAEFRTAGLTRFGSGWAWLTVDGDGALAVSSTPNQDTPIMDGLTPLLGMDVWEHAYYLNYQNRRGDYIEAFWNVINWARVAERHAAATS